MMNASKEIALAEKEIQNIIESNNVPLLEKSKPLTDKDIDEI